MLKKIKQLSLKTLKTAGVFSLVQKSKWRSERLLILAYHGISLEDEHQWNPELFMHPDFFRTRMQLLKNRGCTVLPLNEAIQRLYNGTLPKNCVAITFDDGYYDFYQQALPILKEFNFTATLYLATLYTGYNLPVFDAICPYLIWKGQNRNLDLRNVTGKNVKIALSSTAARERAEDEIIKFARQERLSVEEKDSLAAKLAAQLQLDYSSISFRRILQLLNPHEINQLAAEGIDIQLHTHRHRVPQDRQSFYQEIQENRDSIRVMTGTSAEHFCYPSGIYDQAFFPWLKDLGIASATTCDPGLASKQSNQLLLPRFVDTSMQSGIEFEGWLTGVSQALPHRQSSLEDPRVVWEFASN